MAKVAVVEEEIYDLMVFDDDCYEKDVEIPDDLHDRWLTAQAEFYKLEEEIIAIARQQRGDW